MHFSNNEWFGASFHVSLSHLYVFFGENVYLDLLPIFWLGCLFFLTYSCMSSLYILEINPLLVTLFENILSHSVGCIFILFMVFFVVQKLLSLIRSHFLEFCFYFHYTQRWFQKDITVIYVKECSAYVFLQELYSVQL